MTRPALPSATDPAAGTSGAPLRRGRALAVALALVAIGATLTACSSGSLTSSGPDSQYSRPSAIASAVRRATGLSGQAIVSGALRAPGGPYLRDEFGRVVFFRGVNAVYKRAPFVLTPTLGQPNTFNAADAAAIARLGFNVVRLGIEWEGLEPGHGGANQPAVCTPGRPANPHMYVASIARGYLAQVARIVDLLARDHVYTLLDMHQDVYTQAFSGEGAPAWALCTDGEPAVPVPGRWSRNYRNGALDIAVAHFWENDVVGNLQGQFDQMWGVVARYFRHSPWVVGFDPYNEPFERGVMTSDRQTFAGLLECFYTGRHHPGVLADADHPIACPATVPALGVVPTIERADPGHLLFVEPDLTSTHGRPNLLGRMDFDNLVLNFHAYCGFRSPVTGDPTNVPACANQILHTMLRRAQERQLLSTPNQPGGPAWFMSEFGATQNRDLLDLITTDADLLQLGWTYWSWKYYDDPTGSSHEALASPNGQLEPTASVLSRPYPEAIAGTPVAIDFDSSTARFELTYAPSAKIKAPTIVEVPAALHYPRGYCTVVDGGVIASAPGSPHLLVSDRGGDAATTVTVTIAPGPCRGGTRAYATPAVPPTTATTTGPAPTTSVPAAGPGTGPAPGATTSPRAAPAD